VRARERDREREKERDPNLDEGAGSAPRRVAKSYRGSDRASTTDGNTRTSITTVFLHCAAAD
jgi:hypothetical protein